MAANADAPDKREARMGLFWWDADMPLTQKKLARLERIAKYFTEERLTSVLLPVIRKDNTLSLRALDWLVTNYAKKFPVVYAVTPPDCPPVVVNVYRSYKAWLWNHKRKNFDPFRRGPRIFFNCAGETHESTVGQLNFFFWASRYGVLEYARTHIAEIERDQAATTRSAAAKERDTVLEPKRKRRQLSQAPKETVFVYQTPIRIVFNP